MSTPGEFGRLARLGRYLQTSSGAVPVGVGDDAAVVSIDGTEVIVCVDTVVEGVHFRRDLSTPADVGWKSLVVNVSDIAAMGGVPRAAVVALNRPADLREADIQELYVGMDEAAQVYGVAVVGGDTVTATEWSVAVTMLGALPARPAVARSGARPGELVIVAGRIGAAACALWADANDRPLLADHLHAHRRPRALPRSGQALAGGGATAMIDLSDGLGADARHVCEASGVSMVLEQPAVEAVVAEGVRATAGPDWLQVAVGGGEDFALLATVPSRDLDRALAAVDEAGETTATVVGEVQRSGAAEAAVWLADTDRRQRIDHLGYDHG